MNGRSEEGEIWKRLEDLKSRMTQLHGDITCLKQCAHLSGFLHKIYEIREVLNQLEQGLLQTHLRCCISPNIQVPREVIHAVSKLSEKRHGAIVVIAHEDDLNENLQGGVVVDAAVSAPVLENIFYPGSPLHDGAVIIQGGMIRKAGVLLPLAAHTSELQALDLGSRHRAALGLSQLSDALIIVTEWDELRNLDMRAVKVLLKNPVVVDGRNIYDPKEMRALGFTYLGIGR